MVEEILWILEDTKEVATRLELLDWAVVYNRVGVHVLVECPPVPSPR